MISIFVLSSWPQTLQGPLKKREVGPCRCQSEIKGQQAIFKEENRKAMICTQVSKHVDIEHTSKKDFCEFVIHIC